MSTNDETQSLTTNPSSLTSSNKLDNKSKLFINKIDNTMKKKITSRWLTALIMIGVGIFIIAIGILSDSRHVNDAQLGISGSYDSLNINVIGLDGLAFYIPKWANLILGFSVVTIITSISFPISKELNNCFVRTKNKKIIAILYVIQTLPVLITSFLILYVVYWLKTDALADTKIFSIIYFVLLLSAFFTWIFLFLIIKKSSNSNKFNNVVYPLISILISISLITIEYLLIVRGIFTVVLIVLIPIFADSGAFFTGIFFGKHKIAPVISPKKTWEGFFGGVIIATSLAMLIIWLFGFGQDKYQLQGNLFGNQYLQNDTHETLKPGTANWYLIMAAIFIILCVVSFFGDLVFSLIKRKNNIKDYSNTFKEHGGYLDRVDSWVFVFAIFGIITSFISIVSSLDSAPEFGDRIFNVVYFN